MHMHIHMHNLMISHSFVKIKTYIWKDEIHFKHWNIQPRLGFHTSSSCVSRCNRHRDFLAHVPLWVRRQDMLWLLGHLSGTSVIRRPLLIVAIAFIPPCAPRWYVSRVWWCIGCLQPNSHDSHRRLKDYNRVKKIILIQSF